MAENEELKSLLMRLKEESEKAGLKVNIQKTKGREAWRVAAQGVATRSKGKTDRESRLGSLWGHLRLVASLIQRFQLLGGGGLFCLSSVSSPYPFRPGR